MMHYASPMSDVVKYLSIVEIRERDNVSEKSSDGGRGDGVAGSDLVVPSWAAMSEQRQL